MRKYIFYLQSLHGEEVFCLGIQLFLSKWEASEMEFIRSFKKKWIEKNGKWYEGYSKFTPSTNNVLEASNRVIKDEQLLRERLPIGRIRIVVLDIVK